MAILQKYRITSHAKPCSEIRINKKLVSQIWKSDSVGDSVPKATLIGEVSLPCKRLRALQ